MSGIMMSISTTFIFLALGTWVSSLITRQTLWRWLIVAVVLILSLSIPVVDSNPWLWINGATGELSIVSLILLAGFILRKLAGCGFLSSSTRIHLYILMLLAGTLLFPATLGLTQFDPYVLGYGFEISLLLLSLSILYWIFKQRQIAMILLTVVAAGEAGILSSFNGWDYFIDPLLWLFSPVLLIILLIEKRKADPLSRIEN
ncbi:hypothetical protein BMS3Bbin11_01772 [bacterium BMS3Bbin11]|nr:hypothetical protein BMS3Abin11_00769 [bacterium BMS3Abin11]GBE46671.1 hypothetical protein BMS3Bbin11_01772 [bacterium BMS3Bbin11]GMT39986.1 MAG: hypothetical protein IEMM0001_0721 [bacterium]HDH15084.1 hypothetical protein [Gammaproteobacteria bacterium]